MRGSRAMVAKRGKVFEGESSCFVLAPFAGHFCSFSLFKCYRTPNEQPGDQPDKRKKEHAQNEPGECEAEDSRCHQFRQKIIEQRQTQQRDHKGGSADDRELELTTHQAAKKILAMHV